MHDGGKAKQVAVGTEQLSGYQYPVFDHLRPLHEVVRGGQDSDRHDE